MQSYRSNEAFECYRTYLALKRHFTTSYDFFKYNGKVKVSIHSFENRSDKYQFAKLAKNSQWKELILANVVENQNVWIGDLSEEPLLRMKKRRQALLYYYTNEIKKLAPTFNVNFEVFDDATHPYLFERYLDGDVSIDTMVILNSLVNYIPHWDKNIKETIIWPKHSMLIKKYEPFLSFDKDKFKKKTYEWFK